MFRLGRHIEILLTRYDCVILPRFGGFVKHHISATYSENDGVMLPPREVVGFNAQLTLNDSLLVQSYVDAYDYSYPEALTIVEKEIEELRSTLVYERRYEVGGVGELSMSDDGIITFEPLCFDILVPELYGFTGIEIASLDNPSSSVEALEDAPNIISISEEETANDVYTIRLSRRVVRRVAAAVVALMLVASIPFIGKNINTKEFTSGLNLNLLYSLIPKTGMTNNGSINAIESATVDAGDMSNICDAGESEISVGDDAVYTVVLASKIPKRNAIQFVERLRNDNNISAQMIPQGKAFRVVCGSYATIEEARQVREKLSFISELSDAWVASFAEL